MAIYKNIFIIFQIADFTSISTILILNILNFLLRNLFHYVHKIRLYVLNIFTNIT